MSLMTPEDVVTFVTDHTIEVVFSVVWLVAGIAIQRFADWVVRPRQTGRQRNVE